MNETTKILKALVVDDEGIQRENMREILETLAPLRIGLDFQVETAADYDEFRDIVLKRGFRPDLILLDNNFGNADGRPQEETKINQGLTTFAKAIQSWREKNIVPAKLIVLLVTAADWAIPGNPKWLDIGIKIGEVGFQGAVPKPYTADQLLAAVDRCVRLPPSADQQVKP